MATTNYWPEMGDVRPAAQMDVQYAGPNHYRLKTPLDLSGKGVTLEEVLTAKSFVDPSNPRVGWKVYRVTRAAFARIEREHSVARECLLD